MMISANTVDYLLGVICHRLGDSWKSFVEYGKNPTEASLPLFIVQSDFFDDAVYGTESSIPTIPLKEIEGKPVLFGDNRIERQGNRIIIYADLVASAYFFFSRYEEFVRSDVRDVHGRFPGRESLPYRAGFIHRPLIDEYSSLVASLASEQGISVGIQEQGFSHIFLTHDVDDPWSNAHAMGAIRPLGRMFLGREPFRLYPILNMLGRPEQDPLYAFSSLMEVDTCVKGAEQIYFLKSGGHCKPQDSAVYINSKSFTKLKNLLIKASVTLGYHVSYAASKDTLLLPKELKTLEEKTSTHINCSRNHYLASLNPMDYEALIENGIGDDFTMGYADVAGFRLGITRCVQWINPVTGEVRPLRLHHLTMMDVTLTDPRYMGMSEKESIEFGKCLMDEIFKYGGELSLLFHNNIVNAKEQKNWQIYKDLLAYVSGLNNN